MSLECNLELSLLQHTFICVIQFDMWLDLLYTAFDSLHNANFFPVGAII